jgi:hypothetical protein
MNMGMTEVYPILNPFMNNILERRCSSADLQEKLSPVNL